MAIASSVGCGAVLRQSRGVLCERMLQVMTFGSWKIAGGAIVDWPVAKVQYPVSDGCDSDGSSKELPRGRVSSRAISMVHCSHTCGNWQVLSESSTSS